MAREKKKSKNRTSTAKKATSSAKAAAKTAPKPSKTVAKPIRAKRLASPAKIAPSTSRNKIPSARAEPVSPVELKPNTLTRPKAPLGPRLANGESTPSIPGDGKVIRIPAIPARAKRSSSNSKPSANSSRAKADTIQFPVDGAPPRTFLTEKQLQEFRGLLLQKRAELCGDVARLTDEALNRKNEGQGDQSSMPIHMADLGTDNWEQEFTLGLIANEKAVVREIDEALERIGNKTYGMCLATHRPISLARLQAKPWAKYCIEYARAREEGRAI